MANSWLVFDRIRAIARANRIYQHERNFQDQSSLDQMRTGNDVYDWNQQASILDQTNVFLNRLQRYKDYDQMDQVGVINLSLDLMADEVSLVDPERKRTLIIRAKSRRVKKVLEELYFNTLMWDSNCRPTARYLAKFGDCPYEVITTKNRDGVASLKHIDVYNFTRVETKRGDLVGFYYTDEFVSTPQFMHPWQCMHLRLSTLEKVYNPYGRAWIDGSRKAFKQLRLMEDAALVYRLTRAPDRRKFTIPIGNIPNKEVPEYLASIARTFKRHKIYNPQTGTFDERYSPLIQEDDYFLPRRPDGVGPDVENIQGASNINEIKDIEYFKKNMVAPLKIPFARVGIGEDAGKANEKSLASTSPEFAKSVQWVQREMATGLTKVGIIHLLLKGFSIDDVRGFELILPSGSAIEELYRMETWQTRVDVMQALKELEWFPKEWIVTHFTDITPDELIELKEMAKFENDSSNADMFDLGGGGGGGGGGMGKPPKGSESFGDIDFGTFDDGDENQSDADALGGGEGGLGDEGAGEAGEEAPVPEGVEAEQKLILEYEEYTKNQGKLLFESLLRKIAKPKSDIMNMYDFILNNNDLDGLTFQSGEIIEPGLALDEINDTRESVKLILESNMAHGLASEDVMIEDDEIGPDDMPTL